MNGEALPAYRVLGPSAYSGDWRRFVHLTTTLALNDWKLRFFGSLLGYVWSLLRPLLLFGILYLVFSHVVRVGGHVADYPIQLLIGVILFTYFADVASGAVESLVDSEPLLRKVAFPRMVIPLAGVMTASFNLFLNLLTVGVFVVASGIHARLTWLLLPVPVLALMVLGTGVAMLVSALYVPFRDVRPIWDVVQQALFYATPIFYPIEAVAERNSTLAHAVMFNPLAVIVQSARHFLLGPSSASPVDAVGGVGLLLVPLGILAAIVAVGFYVFNRMAPYVAEQL
jgi:ABC-2 type transport system permease protein